MWTVQWVSSKAITVASRLIDNMTEGIHLEVRQNKIHHPKSIKTSLLTKGNNLNYVCHKGLASWMKDKFINQMWLAEFQQFFAYLNSHIFVFHASQTTTSSWPGKLCIYTSQMSMAVGETTYKYVYWLALSHAHTHTHSHVHKNK